MIRVESAPGITRLILDRPEKANALTAAMLAELDAAVAAAQTPVLVLTGAGTVFSAGADLGGMADGLGQDPAWEQLSARIADYPGLSIAALNGTAAGGALGMVLACDLRVCVPWTTIFYPVMRLGHRPQPSDPARMAALVGPARAKLILMAGARLSAQDAQDVGLIDRISDDLNAAIAELTADALSAAPAHVAALKAMFKT